MSRSAFAVGFRLTPLVRNTVLSGLSKSATHSPSSSLRALRIACSSSAACGGIADLESLASSRRTVRRASQRSGHGAETAGLAFLEARVLTNGVAFLEGHGVFLVPRSGSFLGLKTGPYLGRRAVTRDAR